MTGFPDRPLAQLVEQVEEQDRVDPEDAGHDHGEPREVALDDVLAALGLGREAQAAEAVSRPECMSTRTIRKIEIRTCQTARAASIGDRIANVFGMEARERVQKLLVQGDNRLKQGHDARAREKARESYERALAVAIESRLEGSVRPLVERRLADLGEAERESHSETDADATAARPAG